MKSDVDLSQATWVRSSGSANHLEVAFVGDVVALRDSTDVGEADAKVLVISRQDYEVFVGGVMKGELRA